MRILRAVLPNVTIALNVSLLVVYYLDMRNPMMGFLVGTPFYTLAILTGVCSIATAVLMYASWRIGSKPASDRKKVSNNT